MILYYNTFKVVKISKDWKVLFMMVDEQYDKALKSLLKNRDLGEWEKSLNNSSFLDYVSHYRDKDNNSVYHILLDKKLSYKEIPFMDSIIKLLIQFGVPTLILNNKEKLPSDMAKEISIYSYINLFKSEKNQYFQIPY